MKLAECQEGGNPQDDCLLAKVDGDSAKLWTTFRPGQIDMPSSTYFSLVEGLRRLEGAPDSGTYYIAGFEFTFGAFSPREEQDVPSTHVGDDRTLGVIIKHNGTTLFANTDEWTTFLKDFVHSDGTSG